MESYVGMLAANFWDNLFSEGFVEKLEAFILKLHRKRAEYIKQMKKQSVPYAIFILVDVKIISLFIYFVIFDLFFVMNEPLATRPIMLRGAQDFFFFLIKVLLYFCNFKKKILIWFFFYFIFST